MAKYVKLFATVSDYTDTRANNYFEPWLSYVKETSGMSYNKSEEEVLLETPLTFKVTGNGNIVWKTTSSSSAKTVEYSKNDGAWTQITSTEAGVSIPVVAGDVVRFRGNNDYYGGGRNGGYGNVNCFSGTTCQCELEGNIMSLLNSTGFSTLTAFTSDGVFTTLFRHVTGLTSAEKLKLPSSNVKYYGYAGLFSGCTGLVIPPKLNSVTNLAGSTTFSHMFRGCTSLIVAPELPLTSIAWNCYDYMFAGCTSLTKAPVLPAPALRDYSYQGMFSGCTNLNYVECYATDWNGYTGPTQSWLRGVSSTGTFVKSSLMVSTWGTGDSGIPTGWTIIEKP